MAGLFFGDGDKIPFTLLSGFISVSVVFRCLTLMTLHRFARWQLLPFRVLAVAWCFITLLPPSHAEISAPRVSSPRDSSHQSQWISAASPAELMAQALTFFNAAEYQAAIALWSQVIMANPPEAIRNEALINRSKSYLVISQPALALADLDACNIPVNQTNNLANLWLLKGTALLQLQRYADSIKAFNDVERLQKRNPLLYSNRSVAYQSLGKLQEARADLLVSIALDPKLSNYYNLAVLERYSGNYMVCYKLLSEIIQKSPAYVQAYLQRGLCAAAMGRHEEAVVDMLRVLKIDTVNVDAIEQLGLSLAASGKPETARPYLLKASSIRLAMGQVDQYQRLLKILSSLGSR
jgi:tetratricopeptide (TPR) repeat protein